MFFSKACLRKLKSLNLLLRIVKWHTSTYLGMNVNKSHLKCQVDLLKCRGAHWSIQCLSLSLGGNSKFRVFWDLAV